ncbi:hypothetical protein ACRYCC_25970 [Actinomadura scrupuli]|uniref:hypothetical protein n=1 Tax=Actinomadura scrupuli TaxID=559629 RepID=UPI003D9588A5
MNTIAGKPEGWKRVGRAVRARRLAIGLKTQVDLYTAGGPGVATISKIETGRSPSYEDQVIYRLEDALRWKRGSVQGMLDGAEDGIPLPSEAETPAPGSRFQPERDSPTREYPPLVGTDPAFRALYDLLEGLLTHEERLWAVRGVVMYRSSEAERAAARNQDASGEQNVGRGE